MGDVMVAAAAALLGLVVPVTLLVIYPTNKQLLDPGLDPGVATRRASWRGGIDCTRFAAFSAAWRSRSSSYAWHATGG